MFIKRWRIFLLVASFTLLVPLGTQMSAADESKPEPIVGMDGFVFGGSYGGVSYGGILTGGRPKTLNFPSSMQSLQATGYFVNFPEFDATGSAITGEAEVTYRWEATSCLGGNEPYTQPLTDWETVTVPVDPSASHTRLPMPTVAIRASVEVPVSCGMLGVRFDPAEGVGGGGLEAVEITRMDDSQFPDFDPERDAEGRVVVYSVTDAGEIEEINRSGKLSAVPTGALRYFFASCPAAREVASLIPNAGGVSKVSVDPAGLSGKLVGVTARQAGAPDRVAWGVEQIPALTDAAASVVSEDQAGCL